MEEKKLPIHENGYPYEEVEIIHKEIIQNLSQQIIAKQAAGITPSSVELEQFENFQKNPPTRTLNIFDSELPYRLPQETQEEYGHRKKINTRIKKKRNGRIFFRSGQNKTKVKKGHTYEKVNDTYYKEKIEEYSKLDIKTLKKMKRANCGEERKIIIGVLDKKKREDK